MPAYITIGETVTKDDVAQISSAFESGDVVVCNPICLSRSGRKTMTAHLLRAGVAPELVRRCGWATAAQNVEAAPVLPSEHVEAPPEPTHPPAARRRSTRRSRHTPSSDAG